jgi:hypothetical protein
MSIDDYADRFLESCRKRFEAGDKLVVVSCLYWCIDNDVPIPDWLERILKEACYAVENHEIESWDEVFGKPLKKGQRRAVARRNAAIAHKIFQRVEELHAAGKARDKKLFGTVGEEFGVGGTVASELYYKIREEFRQVEDELD